MLQGRWEVCRAVVDGDLRPDVLLQPTAFFRAARHRNDPAASDAGHLARHRADRSGRAGYEHGHAGLWPPPDRQSFVSGKSVAVAVDLGGRSLTKPRNKT